MGPFQVFHVRRHRKALHVPPKESLRAAPRRLEGGELDRAEAAPPVTRHHDAGKVVVRPVTNDHTEDAFRSVLEPRQLLREVVGHRLTGVSGQRVEADTR